MPKLPLSPVPEQENDAGGQWPGSSSSFDGSQSGGSGSPDSAVGRKVRKATPQTRLEKGMGETELALGNFGNCSS